MGEFILRILGIRFLIRIISGSKVNVVIIVYGIRLKKVIRLCVEEETVNQNVFFVKDGVA